MFKRITDSDFIICTEAFDDCAAGSTIPPGHRWWPADERLIAGADPPPVTDFYAAIEAGVDAWLDSTVAAKGYRDIGSAAGYCNSTDYTFKAEGMAALAWRDAVYRRLYDLMAAPPAGSQYLTIQQVIDMLPQPATFGWPVTQQ